MIEQTLTQDQAAWAFTDRDGRIETISTTARHLFGHANPGRGDDLLKFFPLPRKALLFDIEVALTGWPTQRTVVVSNVEGRPITMQYRVSRRLQESSSRGSLYWHLRLFKAIASDGRCRTLRSE